jgi:enoyl-CoA hydratase
MSLHHIGEGLDWHQEGAVLTVSLHRAPCNEIGTHLLAELEQLAEVLIKDRGEISALVWHSELKSGFSAGADLRELQKRLAAAKEQPGALDLQPIRDFVARVHAVFNTLDALPITTVAAIHGVCFGGGFELALTADILIADKTARFAFPELRLGLIPGFGGIPRLQRDVGNAVVRDLLMTGRSLRAKRAYELGLVSQLVGAGKALTVAQSVATQAAQYDPLTVATAKAFIKPIPNERLAAEHEQFVRLFGEPTVLAALTQFVHSQDVRPYLL